MWSLVRRREVLDICKSRKILIVEDNSYGDLHFRGIGAKAFYREYPSCIRWTMRETGGRCCISAPSAKTVVPALRTGWAAGNKKMIDTMVMAKRLADWQSSHFNQCLLHYLLESSTFNIHEHIRMLNREYETRLKLMTELLKRPAWKHVSFEVPRGGMFLWVKLPDALDGVALLKCSLDKGAAFLPGSLCYPNGGGSGYIRLNFTHPGRDELLLGMNLIGEAISEFTARS
ncbi:aminotransferase class I/II-fold pyridoxal phosphate-dependent enzyme [Paenibacillus sp. JTLBN-2024]